MIAEGRFEHHVVDLQNRTRLAKRMAVDLLNQQGATIFCTREHTLYLWVQFPGIHDSTAFTKKMLGLGVTLAPGSMFLPQNDMPSPWFRFNVGFMSNKADMAPIWSEIRR